MLTRVLAIELARYNIQVNAIAPGPVKTNLTEDMWSVPENLRAVEAAVPLGRWAEPDDMVGSALFLASGASSYLTGQTIIVDGGITA